MKWVIILFVVLFMISCTRTYNVMPKQVSIITDPASLEKVLESECFQTMGFEITVEDIAVPKTTELELSPRIK